MKFLFPFVALLMTLCSASALAQTEPEPTLNPAASVQPPAVAQQTFELMLGAIEDGDYATFVSRGDENFKTTLTKPQFDSVATQLAAPFKRGAHTRYLGVLKKSSGLVYLWALSFGEDGTDSLVQMTLKDEKVNGFWIM